MERVIQSPANPVVKHLVRLREARERRESGLFLVEGLREITRALQSQWTLSQVFACADLHPAEVAREAPGLLRLAATQGAEIVHLGRDAFAKAAYREHPDGLLAVARWQSRPLEAVVLPANPLVLVVEAVEKPGNLGALLRTADAAGVAATIVCDPRTDLTNPNCLRASQGAFFRHQTCLATTAQAQAWLAAHGLAVWLTTPEAQPLLWQADLAGPCALVMGTEDAGLSAEWLGRDYQRLRLPMHGIGDSLNVSVAAGIFLFEAVRQRRLGP